MTFSYYASYSLRSGLILVHFGRKNKDKRCVRYGSCSTWNMLVCGVSVSHSQQMKLVWLCFRLQQNHHSPALRYVVCMRPGVCPHSSSSRPRDFGWDLFCNPVWLLQSCQALSHPHSWSPPASITLLCPKQQWVVEGRVVPLGFQVGDSFDAWTVLHGGFESH